MYLGTNQVCLSQFANVVGCFKMPGPLVDVLTVQHRRASLKSEQIINLTL